MTDSALRLTGVTKAFDKPVITGLDLDIAPGQLYALLGPNGAGKTTTLRMVVGLTPPDAGTIQIYGIDTRRDPNAAKAITAWLPDEPMLYDKLSPSEYLAFVAGLWRIAPREKPSQRVSRTSHSSSQRNSRSASSAASRGAIRHSPATNARYSEGLSLS